MDAGFLILVVHSYMMRMVIGHAVGQLNEAMQSCQAEKASCHKTTRMKQYVRQFHVIIDQHSVYYLYVKHRINDSVNNI